MGRTGILGLPGVSAHTSHVSALMDGPLVHSAM